MPPPEDRARAAFGDRPRTPSPVLLTIVFGVLLAVVGVTATAQAVMVSIYASASSLNAIVQSDMATLRGFVHDGLDAGIVSGGPLSADQRTRLEGLLGTIQSKGEIVRMELRLPDGSVLAASDPAATGSVVQPGIDFGLAVEQAKAQVAIVDALESEAAPGAPLGSQSVLREYLPLTLNGTVVLVAAIWRDAAPIIGGLDDLRRDVVIVTITAAIIASVALYLVFRGAQGRLSRQSRALVEASLLDPLTGMPNHGNLVGSLAREIERARQDGSSLGIALIDLDGFRLLNDNHGHRAGDDALVAVAELLRTKTAGQLLIGRYGPDEFLLVSTTHDGEALRQIMAEVVDGVSELALQFDGSERLPVSVSIGLCTYPTHGASVTALLSSAVRTLEEAKGSGGNAIRVAGLDIDTEPGVASSFDVLKGLVLAIDTKDRYTKRHSEDVTRYAMFIAERLGLDDDMLQAIQVSGLLHDIGKIGIPDEILRKPGRLTAGEADVIRQHVALGDMIVREVPNLEMVRAGIRFHHERWDGKGYLDGLTGEDIPLIGRILAVADTFSAMTTTRPYRKALDTREAIDRLGDAAGNQLEERLVKVFLDGLEQAADPPLPGQIVLPGGLWTPLRRAA
jgi:diguanylate cyclase (GGDEF)-like protein/putative nucleotidyltransferase with HDIG domain